jgi:DNA-binding response OmpR family regulator
VLLRIVHLLLAMLTIGARLSRAQSTSQAVTQPSVGIRLDESERAVWINGTRVRLGRQSYDLLHEFYKHPNQLRTRSELFARIFNEEYDETDTSHVSRLNTAIHRLRNLLEEDPNQPRHLLTAEGGYRLIVNPD